MSQPSTVEVEELLAWAGFSEFRRVSGRLGVSELFDKAERTGIYVLAFKDGSYYVGKASDVTSRYRDHRVTKAPIDALAFRACTRRELDLSEQSTIRALELAGVTLTNISLTRKGAQVTVSNAEWASAEEIRRFSTDRTWNDLSGTPYDDPVRRAKLAQRYQQLMKRPDAQQLVRGFALYTRRCLPLPARTAYHRWAISALPQSKGSLPAIANLSVGWQWAAICFEWQGTPLFQFYGRGSILKRAFGRDLERLEHCEAHFATEQMGGTDQLRLVCEVEEVEALLNQDHVVEALRDVALHLMHRMTPYGASHCFDLADAIMREARSGHAADGAQGPPRR